MMQSSILMLATTNPGKVVEMRALLSIYLDINLLTILTPDDWPHPLPKVNETGTTFEDNARLKSQSLAHATGVPCLADDSGLCVDALEDAPGVFSARWAGEGVSDTDRNHRLLTAIANLPVEQRTAQFICVLALAMPSGKTITATGMCSGVILDMPRGKAGFGYDPLFLMPSLGRTMAELTHDEKNRVSHRAKAFAILGPHLRDFLFEAI